VCLGFEEKGKFTVQKFKEQTQVQFKDWFLNFNLKCPSAKKVAGSKGLKENK